MSGAVVRDGARILLVEDDELNRALVRAIVSRCAEPELRGAQLVEAGDLAQARAAIEDAPVDVMLLDMGLPDGSGLDLAAELRDSPRGRAPAIVAVTGNSAAAQTDAAMAAGCQAVLTKPYAAADLRALLASLLRRDRAAPDQLLVPCGFRSGDPVEQGSVDAMIPRDAASPARTMR